jgi:hypothetical protein
LKNYTKLFEAWFILNNSGSPAGPGLFSFKNMITFSPLIPKIDKIGLSFI